MMAASSSGVYDFTNEGKADLWRGLLQPALRKVCFASYHLIGWGGHMRDFCYGGRGVY